MLYFIYKISCKDQNIPDVYSGSTMDLTKRSRMHKSCCNNPKSEKYNQLKYRVIRQNGGWDNWIIEVVEIYECTSKVEARIREQFWTNQNNNSLNINKAYTELKGKDYSNNYRLSHKAQFNIYNKNYRLRVKQRLEQAQIIARLEQVENDE